MIAEETIDRVRQQAAIAAVVEQTVRLTRRGRSLVGLCPFHKEKTPSFHVNPERGFYHCFGCGASGDAIRFVQETEGLSFHEAVRALAERFGIEIVETANEAERNRLAEARRREKELYEVGHAAAAFFEQQLREHPLAGIAVAELHRRGLSSQSPTDPVADALQAFRVGYAPYSWDALGRYLKQAGFSTAAAEAVGLTVPRKTRTGSYDRFRHRLMFAVLDAQGRVVAFSGRILPPPEPAELEQLGIAPLGGSEDEGGAKYLNSPESPIYKKREMLFGIYQARTALRESQTAVLVEGNFDVVSLFARGIKNVVAPLGTAFTLEQAKIIRRFASRVTVMFDGDTAGKKATAGVREAIHGAGLVCRVATLPDGQDPDDLVRTRGREALLAVLGAAKGLLEYSIDSIFEARAEDTDAVARAAKLKQVTQLLATEPDPEVRLLGKRYADAILQRLGITDGPTALLVAERVQRSLGQAESPVGAPRHRLRSADRREQIGHDILGALLDHPALLDEPELMSNADVLVGDLALALATIRQLSAEQPSLVAEQFLASLPRSIHSFAASRLAAPRYERQEDARTVLLQNLEKLRRLEHVRRTKDTLEALNRAAAVGDYEAEIALLREQMEQARQRHGVGER